MICVQGHTIGVKQYQASENEASIILLALQSYGFVLKKPSQFMQLKTFSFSDFADQIASVYDTEEPRTAAILETLRTVHARNFFKSEINMWSTTYKGYYIHGYCDRDECTALCSPTGYGYTWKKAVKSMRAAKLAITRHINGK